MNRNNKPEAFPGIQDSEAVLQRSKREIVCRIGERIPSLQGEGRFQFVEMSAQSIAQSENCLKRNIHRQRSFNLYLFDDITLPFVKEAVMRAFAGRRPLRGSDRR